jgi:hypothetical protein
MKVEDFMAGRIGPRKTWNVADLLAREPFAMLPIPDGPPLPSEVDQPLLFLLSIVGSGIFTEMRAIRQHIASEPPSNARTEDVAARPPRQGIESEIAVDIRTLLQRITEHFTPQEVVGTDYVARRLNCTSQYVSRMANEGAIPKACIKVSSGERRQRWKFFRSEIDRWIEGRK